MAEHVTAAALGALPRGLWRRLELSPLRFAVLEREGQLGRLSEAERAAGKRAYYQTLARSVAIRETLALVVSEGARVGAEVLPLKGSVLAFAVYPDPGMRPMADVDVAVSPDRLEALAARLEALGYARYGAGKRRYQLAHHHHLALFKAGAPPIELHARLFHELALDGDTAPLFARAIPPTALSEVEGRNRLNSHPSTSSGLSEMGSSSPTTGYAGLVPGWNDHVLYVALHAATHGFADSPLWLFDLAYLVPRLSPDALAVIAAEAKRRRGVAALHFAFALATRCLPSLLLAAPPPTGKRLRASLLDALLGADPFARKPDRRRAQLLRWALTDHPIDALRSIAGKLRLVAAEALFETAPPPPP